MVYTWADTLVFLVSVSKSVMSINGLTALCLLDLHRNLVCQFLWCGHFKNFYFYYLLFLLFYYFFFFNFQASYIF